MKKTVCMLKKKYPWLFNFVFNVWKIYCDFCRFHTSKKSCSCVHVYKWYFKFEMSSFLYSVKRQNVIIRLISVHCDSFVYECCRWNGWKIKVLVGPWSGPWILMTSDRCVNLRIDLTLSSVSYMTCWLPGKLSRQLNQNPLDLGRPGKYSQPRRYHQQQQQTTGKV